MFIQTIRKTGAFNVKNLGADNSPNNILQSMASPPILLGHEKGCICFSRLLHPFFVCKPLFIQLLYVTMVSDE